MLVRCLDNSITLQLLYHTDRQEKHHYDGEQQSSVAQWRCVGFYVSERLTCVTPGRGDENTQHKFSLLCHEGVFCCKFCVQ